MASLITREGKRIVTEGEFVLQYEVTRSINPVFDEFELWEFGLHCELFDDQHVLLSKAQVRHITPKEELIQALLDTMLQHKVFPVHLVDVVSDELIKYLDCE